MYVFWIIAFLLGAVVGSFLNVIIYRLYKEQSTVSGRSFCPHCKHKIRWYDLIPILSFFILKAKCRDCKHKISWWYPVVEIATGLLFVLVFMRDFSLDMDFIEILFLIYLLYITATLIVIFVYDIKYLLIADIVVLPAAFIALILNIFIFNQSGYIDALINYGTAGLFGAAFFWIQYVITKGKGIGGGDLRIGILMGTVLGWPYIIFALGLAYLIGSIYSIFALIFAKASMKSKIPLGPFLSLATFAFLLYYKSIIYWLYLILYS